MTPTKRYDPYARADLMTVSRTMRDIRFEIMDHCPPEQRNVDGVPNRLHYDAELVKDVCCLDYPVSSLRQRDGTWGLKTESGDATAIIWLTEQPTTQFTYRGERLDDIVMQGPKLTIKVINEYCVERAERYTSLRSFTCNDGLQRSTE